TNAVDEFIHPCERQVFMDIMSILNKLSEIVRFANYFGIATPAYVNDFDEASEYSTGCYIKQFAIGVESALEQCYQEIQRLESLYKNTAEKSLIYIYNTLELQLPAIRFLPYINNKANKLITISLQKLHGCAVLQNLHRQSEYGEIDMDIIISKVTKPVKTLFFAHLAQWMLFGLIDDPHDEFFINHKPLEANSSDKISPNNSRMLSVSSVEEVWQYEINMSQVPGFVSCVLAEKILFVGQTVIVFKLENNLKKHNAWTTKLEKSYCDDISELWDGKESTFYKLIEALSQEDKLNIFRLEDVVNEIKRHVSQRLSEIAAKEDDLERQLGLIKDFYLLGRGEFYLEFLRQLYEDTKDVVSMSERDYTKAFENAANVMGITDDLDNFTLSVQKSSIDFDESCEYATLQNLQLKYVCKWPLNLLFSPIVNEGYNKVFRFLLIVKKLQYNLHLVWARHKWASKLKQPVSLNIMNFRNHLMFFMDNLQYYIQVDVLESQYSIFMNIIKSKADFGEIQKGHSVFLANVLSQCFLLTEANELKPDLSQTTYQSQYPIYGTILEIFNICEKFSNINCLEEPAQNDLKEIEILEEKFNVSIANLIKLLVDIKSSTSFGTLSQLILRLDYNRWFSAKNGKHT
ncbi:Grip75, partial [Drosophila busckii]